MRLGRWGITGVVAHRVVLAHEGDGFSRQHALDDAHRFGESRHAHRRKVERDTRFVVFGFHVARADAEFEAPAGEQVDRGGLAREQHRVPEVVVHHEAADPDVIGRVGGAAQRGERREPVGQMVGREEDIEPEFLGAAGLFLPLATRSGRPDRNAETERAHERSLGASIAIAMR